MSKSFSEILDAAPTELEASVPLPVGEYELEAVKADVQELTFDFGSHAKGDQFLNIIFKPVAPIDVDEDDLEQCETWRDEIVSLRIFPEEMGDKFCDTKSERGIVYHLGLDPNDYETTADLIGAVSGAHCAGTIVHAPNKNDPDRPYVNLKQTAPL